MTDIEFYKEMKALYEIKKSKAAYQSPYNYAIKTYDEIIVKMSSKKK